MWKTLGVTCYIRLAPPTRAQERVSKKGALWGGFLATLRMETKKQPFHNWPGRTNGCGTDRTARIRAVGARRFADYLMCLPLIPVLTTMAT